jgi:hypothetical protein
MKNLFVILLLASLAGCDQPKCQRSQAEDSRGSGYTPAGEQFQTGPVPASTPTPRSQVEVFQL